MLMLINNSTPHIEVPRRLRAKSVCYKKNLQEALQLRLICVNPQRITNRCFEIKKQASDHYGKFNLVEIYWSPL